MEIYIEDGTLHTLAVSAPQPALEHHEYVLTAPRANWTFLL